MRETIIASAIEVFNQKGLKNSTLRDIAKEMSISDGHLRYYFRTKEDLILSVFAEMDAAIVSIADEVTRYDSVAQEIIESLSRSFMVMYRYGFFFNEPLADLQAFPKLYIAYLELIERRKELFMDVFRKYKEVGIFSPDVDAELFPVLFEQFFIISDNWVRYTKLPNRRKLDDTKQVRYFVAVSVALFLPYLSVQVREELLKWVKATCR
ncbi:TetR/AcrR family transcriptional regulator [Telluribacter humicola]|uniref:TetR/AcrR family transcriptional regulator n=1 Tax=Telluribacter humicola TaxID=1720261 RepID=UPI001A968B85|nr:TetR/AcrR family transcriptional regulator [Telluribacter humicola]